MRHAVLAAAPSISFALWTGRVGGWVGLGCGLVAMYLSFAEVTNGTFGRTVVPLGAPILRS